MPKSKLTDIAVSKLPEGMHWDSLLPAFGVRVGKQRRTFLLIQNGGRRHALGHYPKISLAKARELARAHMEGPPPADRFPVVVDAYVERHLKPNCRQSHAIEIERLLRKHFPFTGAISSITKRDVLLAVDKLSRKSLANHATVAIKMLFNWAEENAYIERNPIDGLPRPYTTAKRTRVLTDEELKKIWNATSDLSDFSKIIRLCLLTAQRRGEVAKIEPAWCTGSSLTIPASITKNKREHCIPLAAPSRALVETSPFSCAAWSKPKRRLDEAAGVHNWTIHDLRRTASTTMARIGVAPHVIERILNHTAPESLGGEIGTIYNQHRYLKEMTEAFERYGAHLTSIGLDLTDCHSSP